MDAATRASPGSELDGGNGIQAGQVAADAAGTRVWRACLPCRRKKVKCDGKQPCHNCISRDQDCGFPESQDNASASRHYGASFEARCQQMSSLCERLESLTAQLTLSIDMLNDAPRTSAHRALADTAQADLLQAAQVLRSMPQLNTANRTNDDHSLVEVGQVSQEPFGNIGTRQSRRHRDHLSEMGDEDLDSVSDDVEEGDASDRTNSDDESRTAGAMIRDSYGHLRFVGGASNTMLIEAARHSVSPNTLVTDPSPLTDNGEPVNDGSAEYVELPLFVHGKIWPELPFLPRPEQLSRPPQFVADMLVKFYFDQLHYTFPVIFKPDFMARYKKISRFPADASQATPSDRHFLLVFYSICACASSLMPPSTESGFPGIEYYEKALLLYYATTGEASLERVQCLALLSMCSAGWNTVTQSWTLAGQAVRAAQDIGIHLSNPLGTAGSKGSSKSDLLERQISRRVWWSVYILDRTTSICLGRPMGAHDDDCSWELPLNVSDDELERQLKESRRQPNAQGPRRNAESPPTTGFLAFARLCRISGRIQQLGTPQRLKELTSTKPGCPQKFLARVLAYDRALRKWLDSLPDSIRFSANISTSDITNSTDLVMCVVSFIVHAGSLLNLYRYFIGHSRHVRDAGVAGSVTPEEAVSQCRSAAKSCINAAEMVRDLVPPSHHLAICVHYLTLSGVVLLRLPSEMPSTETIQDAQRCVGFLKDLEQRWSGATRSRDIIERLLASYTAETVSHHPPVSCMSSDEARGSVLDDNGVTYGSSGKRPFAQYDTGSSFDIGDEDFYLNQVLGSELFTFENPDAGFSDPWGRI